MELIGAFDRFIVKNIHPKRFVKAYEWALYQSRFYVTERDMDGIVLHHKAIWGDKKTAFMGSHFIPMGNWSEEGNRYGAEAEIVPEGMDVYFELLVVSYMSIFDVHDYFLITQGIIEKLLDDDRSRKKLNEIVSRLMSYKLEMFTIE
jgi:phosphatidylserine/phosphatidylglycerophosphate/cardiolipin synthase-like enzyme